MDDIPEVYELTSIEQLRAVSDRLRLRIADLLGWRAMTVAQLSAELGLAHAKVHYHVRELEEVGLVRLVETREKSGILEKYYRTVARGFKLAPTLLTSLPPDERAVAVAEFFQTIVRGALSAFLRDLDAGQPRQELRLLSSGPLFVSDEEARTVIERIHEILRPYEEPREGEGVRERTFVQLLYSEGPYAEEAQMDTNETEVENEPAAMPQQWPASPMAPMPPSAPRMPRMPRMPRPPRQPARPPAPPKASASLETGRRRSMVVGGMVRFTRGDLEEMAASGQPVSLRVLGHCHFDDDIPAELVDRAIARFRYRGALAALPEVRAVLERKAREA